MPTTVVEVIERSQQGMTAPYVCRCDDGAIYFVKGRSATSRGLVAECLCARLGSAFGLPVPPHAIIEVPPELLAADATGWLRDLGPGKVFASRKVMGVDFTEVHKDQVPDALRCDVMVFDWWVRNEDRTLTHRGGNPNLIWDTFEGGKLAVIDHNLAFDPDFRAEDFVGLHVFSDEINKAFSDFVMRGQYEQCFAEALGVWGESCDTFSSSWAFVDPEGTVPVDFTPDSFRALLDRYQDNDFWDLPP